MLPGTRLGPYEIVGALGAGGMGEVFRARDTRLGRDVALKIVPAAAAADPDRMRRFEVEARATAALNHPNILAVFDVGAADGVSFAVSELLEGETLRDRLAGGPLPPRKAIEVAVQLARGLAAAHDKGIVHRDLKPENVFLTRDGHVKILDFGIAKLNAAADASGTIAATMDRGTAPGIVLGTVGYMSPEQVRGLDTDYRTDIFSFGAILYEMLAGRRAFARSTAADTMSAILNADPPEIGEAARAMPPLVERIVRRCLEKNRDERFQSARDLAFDLDGVTHASGSVAAIQASAAPAVAARAGFAWPAAMLAAGLLIGAAAAWTIAGRSSSADIGLATNFQQITFRRGEINHARFAPDGVTVVYSAAWEGRPSELFTARRGAVAERALGVAGILQSVSKNGEIALLRDAHRIASWTDVGVLARVPLGGGAPRDVLRGVGSADWSPDGEQMAITRYMPETRRWRLEYPVGTVLVETTGGWIQKPRIARDGSSVLFLSHALIGDSRGRLSMVTKDGKRTDLTGEYSAIVSAAWSPSGDEAWFTAGESGGRLSFYTVRPGQPARPFAPTPASVILEDVLPDGRVLTATELLKARMLVRTPADAEEREISWFDYPLARDLSADGSTLLFDEQGEGGGPNYSVFVRRTDGTPAVKIAEGFGGRLSPDLQWASARTPSGDRVLVPLGAGEPKRLAPALENMGPASFWFPDGKRMILNGNEPGQPRHAFEYSIDDMRLLRPLTAANVLADAISADGRLLAISGGPKRMLQPLPSGEPRDIPGLLPDEIVLRFHADGRSLLVAAPVEGRQRWRLAQVDFQTGRRTELRTIGPIDTAGVTSVNAPIVSADGRTYVYRYNSVLSDLFVSERLR